ncbi:hypothetical protein JCM10212_003472 [Sporobolomyces blumeae]
MKRLTRLVTQGFLREDGQATALRSSCCGKTPQAVEDDDVDYSDMPPLVDVQTPLLGASVPSPSSAVNSGDDDVDYLDMPALVDAADIVAGTAAPQTPPRRAISERASLKRLVSVVNGTEWVVVDTASGASSPEAARQAATSSPAGDNPAKRCVEDGAIKGSAEADVVARPSTGERERGPTVVVTATANEASSTSQVGPPCPLASEQGGTTSEVSSGSETDDSDIDFARDGPEQIRAKYQALKQRHKRVQRELERFKMVEQARREEARAAGRAKLAQVVDAARSSAHRGTFEVDVTMRVRAARTLRQCRFLPTRSRDLGESDEAGARRKVDQDEVVFAALCEAFYPTTAGEAKERTSPSRRGHDEGRGHEPSYLESIE